MDVQLFITGTPAGGAEAFPLRDKNLIASGDSPKSAQEVRIELVEIIDPFQNIVMYHYRRFDFLTSENGREGAKFGIWLRLGHLETIGNTRFLLDFFRDLFERGFKYENLNFIGWNEKEHIHFFKVNRFQEVGEKLSNVLDVAQKNILSKLDEVIFNRSYEKSLRSTIIFQEKFLPQKSTIVSNDGKTGNGDSKEIDNIFHGQEEVKTNVLESEDLSKRVATLEKQIRYTWLITILSVLILIVFLISLLKYIGDIEVIRAHTQPIITTPQGETLRASRPLITDRDKPQAPLESKLNDPIYIKKDNGEFYLSSLPAEKTISNQIKTTKYNDAEQYFKDLVDILKDPQTGLTQDIPNLGTAINFDIYIKNRNPGDTRELNTKLDNTEGGMSFMQITQFLIDRSGEFILFSPNRPLENE